MASDRFSELYSSYGSAIYARCRRILDDGAAAEDAAQETFLRVHRHIDSAPTDDDALKWMFRIATNYCLNMLRDRQLRPVLAPDFSNAVGMVSPEDRIAEQDFGRQLTARAPEQMRQAAMLYHVYGLGQSEIADELGISRRTVVNYLAAFSEYVRKAAANDSGTIYGRLRRTSASRRDADRGRTTHARATRTTRATRADLGPSAAASA